MDLSNNEMQRYLAEWDSKGYADIDASIFAVISANQGHDLDHVRAKVVKNKVAPPFKEAEFDIMFGEGISKEGDILDLAVSCDIIQKSGAWFAYEGEKIGQGRENAKNYLKQNPDLLSEIDARVREKLHVGVNQAVITDNGDDEEPPEEF